MNGFSGAGGVEVPLIDRPCVRCGAQIYRALHASVIYCSNKCRRLSHHTPGLRGWSSWVQRRKARGLPIGRRATPCAGDIVLRDGLGCHVCGGEIDPLILWPDPYSMTLDHVIPVSRPSSRHQLENLKLAHMKCNVLRGGGSEL